MNPKILEAARAASASLLPEKSKSKYEKVYDQFRQWKLMNKVEEVLNEDLMLAFFYEKVIQLNIIVSNPVFITYFFLFLF